MKIMAFSLILFAMQAKFEMMLAGRVIVSQGQTASAIRRDTPIEKAARLKRE